MDIQKEREAFEKECRLLCYKGNMVMSNLGSFYNNEQTNWMWQMWLSAKAQAVPEWISVKDNLPPANILVLGMSVTRSNIFNIYNVMALDEFEEADVTHWMSLPDAPQEPAND
ncbi:DUF551 domain-containing protein [Acinetobacter johnsonii]|uniref:DUF551 domain-containing protein n=1 Tax=Acinetobacter johnsonii TaxID=40214 RepID=UPI00248FCDDF|nr:DUF551 domain-containing protein [Acinetobacter johnsonii]